MHACIQTDAKATMDDGWARDEEEEDEARHEAGRHADRLLALSPRCNIVRVCGKAPTVHLTCDRDKGKRARTRS